LNNINKIKQFYIQFVSFSIWSWFDFKVTSLFELFALFWFRFQWYTKSNWRFLFIPSTYLPLIKFLAATTTHTPFSHSRIQILFCFCFVIKIQILFIQESAFYKFHFRNLFTLMENIHTSKLFVTYRYWSELSCDGDSRNYVRNVTLLKHFLEIGKRSMSISCPNQDRDDSPRSDETHREWPRGDH